MAFASSIYAGHVVHKRLKPREHRLRYRCFWLLLDLDEVAGIAEACWLFGYNRAGVFAFRERDHGDGSSRPLRGQMEQHLAGAGIDLAGGPIRILCMPRVLGYGFNPLSIYFCHHSDGRLLAIVYEVSNTFGERHSYVAAVDDNVATAGTIRQHAEKKFYVSPFMDQRLQYRFNVERPRERVAVAIEARDEAGPVLVASLAGVRRRLDDPGLAWLALSQPFLTLKVIIAIHWEALRLALKRIRLRPRPSAPQLPVSIVATSRSEEHHDNQR